MSMFGTLLSPVTFGPRGLLWVFEKVQEEADRELNDPVKLRGDLMALQRRAAAGEITDAQYEEQEARILARLDNIEQRQEASRVQASQASQPAPSAGPRRRRGRPAKRVRRRRS